jgi:hypothetical protein
MKNRNVFKELSVVSALNKENNKLILKNATGILTKRVSGMMINTFIENGMLKTQ